MRYTEYHAGVAVIRDKAKHKEAVAKLAKFEDREMTGCIGCEYEGNIPNFYPCLDCMRGKGDRYVKGETD